MSNHTAREKMCLALATQAVDQAELLNAQAKPMDALKVMAGALGRVAEVLELNKQIRTDLEAQLAKTLQEIADRGQDRHGNRACPSCGATMDYGSARAHRDDCKILLALKAFKGDA